MTGLAAAGVGCGAVGAASSTGEDSGAVPQTGEPRRGSHVKGEINSSAVRALTCGCLRDRPGEVRVVVVQTSLV